MADGVRLPGLQATAEQERRRSSRATAAAATAALAASQQRRQPQPPQPPQQPQQRRRRKRDDGGGPASVSPPSAAAAAGVRSGGGAAAAAEGAGVAAAAPPPLPPPRAAPPRPSSSYSRLPRLPSLGRIGEAELLSTATSPSPPSPSSSTSLSALSPSASASASASASPCLSESESTVSLCSSSSLPASPSSSSGDSSPLPSSPLVTGLLRVYDSFDSLPPLKEGQQGRPQSEQPLVGESHARVPPPLPAPSSAVEQLQGSARPSEVPASAAAEAATSGAAAAVTLAVVASAEPSTAIPHQPPTTTGQPSTQGRAETAAPLTQCASALGHPRTSASRLSRRPSLMPSLCLRSAAPSLPSLSVHAVRVLLPASWYSGWVYRACRRFGRLLTHHPQHRLQRSTAITPGVCRMGVGQQRLRRVADPLRVCLCVRLCVRWLRVQRRV